MAPSAIAERPRAEKDFTPKTFEIIPLGSAFPRPQDLRHVTPAFEFSKAVLLEENHFKTGSRTLKILISVATHLTLIALPILLGLYFTDTINIKQYAAMMLVAPPPPPPPPPAAVAVAKIAATRRTFMNAGKLIAPTFIPQQIAELKEAPIEPESFDGVAGGVPGGVPGGQMGGVLGGVIGGMMNSSAKPVAPPVKPVTRLRVGGHVRAPKLLTQVMPEYPALARQAHIQGQVTIDAVLDEKGNVIEMRVISGPSLLRQAALNALSQWKYEPTYLNEQPISVQLIAEVTFQLSQ